MSSSSSIIQNEVVRNVPIYRVIQFQNRYPNMTIPNLSAPQLNMFLQSADRCVQILNAKQSEISPTSPLHNWCSHSAQSWFHTLYFHLWMQAPEKHFLTDVIQPYFIPISTSIALAQSIILTIFLLLLSSIRKSHSLFIFLLYYAITATIYITVVLLLFNIIFTQIFHSTAFCRTQQFLSTTLTALPNWTLAVFCLNHFLVLQNSTKLPPLGRLGCKVVMTCIYTVIIVLNAHSLWLYSFDNDSKSCEIQPHIDSQLFIIGYPFYLQIISDLLPSIVMFFSLFGTLLICLRALKHPPSNPSSVVTNQPSQIVNIQDHLTPIVMGINHILLTTPYSIYWFISHLNPTQNTTRIQFFSELLSNLIAKSVTNILASQTCLMLLPLIISTNPTIRQKIISICGNIPIFCNKSSRPRRNEQRRRRIHFEFNKSPHNNNTIIDNIDQITLERKEVDIPLVPVTTTEKL